MLNSLAPSSGNTASVQEVLYTVLYFLMLTLCAFYFHADPILLQVALIQKKKLIFLESILKFLISQKGRSSATQQCKFT